MKKWIIFFVAEAIILVGVGFYFFGGSNPNNAPMAPGNEVPTIAQTQAIPTDIKTNYTLTATIAPAPAFSQFIQSGKGILTIRIGLKEANRKVLVNDTTIFANLSVPNPQFPYKAQLNLNQLIKNSPNPILHKLVPLPGDTVMMAISYCLTPVNTPGVGMNCPHYGKDQNDSFHSWYLKPLQAEENIAMDASIDMRYQLRQIKQGPIALSGTITLNRSKLNHSYDAPALIVEKHLGYSFNHRKENGFVDYAYSFEPARLLAIKPLKFEGNIANFEIRREELFEPNYNGIVTTVLNDCSDYGNDYLLCAVRAGTNPSTNLPLPIPPEEVLLARGQFSSQLYETGIRLTN